MTNNDMFKKMLHLTGLGRDQELLIAIFRLGQINSSKSLIKGWRTDPANPRGTKMPDQVLDGFFDGLFAYRDMQRDNDVNVFNFTRIK